MDCLPDKISQFDFFFVVIISIPKECSFRIKKNEGKKEVNIKAPTLRCATEWQF